MGGRTQAILVNAHGLPLYYYRPDTATRSLVSGGLARLWPPLTSAAPTAASGVTGKLTVVHDAHGDQVGYNGHLLYTFAGDRAGQVTGQGFQNFFVATAGLTPAHVLGTRHNGPGRPAQRLRVLKVRHALGTANWPMTGTSTLPPVTSRVPVAGHFGPPIRVRLPAGGWQVGFRVQRDGRTVVEVTDADGTLAGLVASSRLPILSIDAGWCGCTRGPAGDRRWWALAIGHVPARGRPAVRYLHPPPQRYPARPQALRGTPPRRRGPVGRPGRAVGRRRRRALLPGPLDRAIHHPPTALAAYAGTVGRTRRPAASGQSRRGILTVRNPGRRHARKTPAAHRSAMRPAPRAARRPRRRPPGPTRPAPGQRAPPCCRSARRSGRRWSARR